MRLATCQAGEDPVASGQVSLLSGAQFVYFLAILPQT